MSKPQIIVTARGELARLVLVEGKRPVELRLFPADARPFAGERLTARVNSIAREINSAFLAGPFGDLLLPFEKARAGKDGSKPRSISECVQQGARVAIEVIREADPGDGKLPVARLLPDDPGATGTAEASDPDGIARLIAAMADDRGGDVTIDERELYLAVKRLGNGAGEITLWTDQGEILEAFEIEEIIEEAVSGQMALPSGGSIIIEETRALTAIDVNSGRADKGRDAGRTRLKTNIEAAGKIAWALRFLDIGGLVVIDFIAMKRQADNASVLKALDQALQGDPARPGRSGFSRFGLVELARQKRGPSVLQRLNRAGRNGASP